MRLRVDHTYTHKFMDEFWNHRLNQLGMRVYEFCDELTRAGELFTGGLDGCGGMSYRARHSGDGYSSKCTARRTICKQEIGYVQKPAAPGEEPRIWPAYNEAWKTAGGRRMLSRR